MYGHVAYVESVSPDRRTFVTSDKNANGCNCSKKVTHNPRSIREGLYFIYGGPAGNGPPSPTHPTPPQPVPPPASDKTAPTTPTGLAVSTLSTNALRVTWTASTDNVGVTGYDLFLNGNRVNTISGRSADFGGLACGTGYTLGVAARDAAGNVSAAANNPRGHGRVPGGPVHADCLQHGHERLHADARGHTRLPLQLSAVLRDGCAIAGTDRNTGGQYSPAVCQTNGARTTNGQDGSPIDDGNPGLFTSTRWYGIRLGGGGLGYISEVWIKLVAARRTGTSRLLKQSTAPQPRKTNLPSPSALKGAGRSC